MPRKYHTRRKEYNFDIFQGYFDVVPVGKKYDIVNMHTGEVMWVLPSKRSAYMFAIQLRNVIADDRHYGR